MRQGLGLKFFNKIVWIIFKFDAEEIDLMVIYSACSDDELILLMKKHNEAAFREIYERYSGLLYVSALKKLKNEDEAKDVVQEVFIALWDKRADLNVYSSFSSYLFKAVHNRALNIFVHQKYKDDYASSFQHYLDYESPQADESLRKKELAALIEREIAALPEKMREVFRLSRNEQLSHKEIAEKLGISELTVKTQVKKALRTLRLKLGLVIYLAFLLGNK